MYSKYLSFLVKNLLLFIVYSTEPIVLKYNFEAFVFSFFPTLYIQFTTILKAYNLLEIKGVMCDVVDYWLLFILRSSKTGTLVRATDRLNPGVTLWRHSIKTQHLTNCSFTIKLYWVHNLLGQTLLNFLHHLLRASCWKLTRSASCDNRHKPSKCHCCRLWLWMWGLSYPAEKIQADQLSRRVRKKYLRMRTTCLYCCVEPL